MSRNLEDYESRTEPSTRPNAAFAPGGLVDLSYRVGVTNVMVGGELQWGRRENFSDGDGFKVQFSFMYIFRRDRRITRLMFEGHHECGFHFALPGSVDSELSGRAAVARALTGELDRAASSSTTSPTALLSAQSRAIHALGGSPHRQGALGLASGGAKRSHTAAEDFS
jgi:hypothetical protein